MPPVLLLLADGVNPTQLYTAQHMACHGRSTPMTPAAAMSPPHTHTHAHLLIATMPPVLLLLSARKMGSYTATYWHSHITRALTPPHPPPHTPVDRHDTASAVAVCCQEDGVRADAVAVHCCGCLQVVYKQQAQLCHHIHQAILLTDLQDAHNIQTVGEMNLGAKTTQVPQ